MIDRYTKILLTIIAIALTTLCIQNLALNAVAQGSACGKSSFDACYVQNSSRDPLYVTSR